MPRFDNGKRRPHLVVMAKEPRAGLVKTRLGREIGAVWATAAARLMLNRTLLVLDQPRRWTLTLAISPDAAVGSRLLPPHIRRMPQGAGDLGARMQRRFERAPPGPVVIVGGDIPALTPAHVTAAFRRLGNSTVVIGPAEDGGYWLIGMSRLRTLPRPFQRVRWSTEHALADTLTQLCPHRVAQLGRLSDLDTSQDWRRLRDLLGRRVQPVPNLQPEAR